METRTESAVAERLALFRRTRSLSQRSQALEAAAEQVLHFYVDKGCSVRDIAGQLPISPSSIYRILHEAGLQPNGHHGNGGKRLFTDEVERDIATAYREGQSMEQLARQYQCGRGAIGKVLKRQAVVRRHRGGTRQELPAALADTILAEWQAGKSQRALSAAHNIPISRVTQILKRTYPEAPERIARGKRHAIWRGGRRLHVGYIMCQMDPRHPFYATMANSNGYVLEHRLVMAESLGRPLTQHESIHHINGDRADNRLANLQLRHGQHGTGVLFRCADCHSTNIIVTPIADIPPGERQLILFRDEPA